MLKYHVEADHFRHYQFPSNLKGNARGGLGWVQKTADLEKNTYNTQLWVLRQGVPLCLLADNELQNFWWQGDVVVFASLRKPEDKKRVENGLPLTVLYTISTVLPGEAQEWLRLEYTISDIAFLPDGKFVFVADYQQQRDMLIQTAENEQQAVQALQLEKQVEVLTQLPFWAEGGGYTNTTRSRLYLFDSGTVTPLTDELTQVECLRLSPNGRYAYYIATSYQNVMPLLNHLCCVDLATGLSQPVGVQADFYTQNYALLDDDTFVQFGTNRQEYGLNQNGSFYRCELAGRQVYELETSGRYNGYNAILNDCAMPGAENWVVGGALCYWLNTSYGSSHLMTITPQGEIQQLTQAAGTVNEVALAGGQIYIIAQRGLDGPEVYCVGENGSESLVTALNSELSSDFLYSRPIPLAYTNNEGDTIEGWVLPPVEYEESKAYPAVLMVHGGPKMAYGAIFNHEMQFLAAQGFAVVFCNPTGSDGRGNDFADVRGRWGLIDYEDLMGFLDAALEQYPWIDAARLAVGGGSYGGFMTNWVIGHTNRFAAAISQRGICNWLSFACTSDIGYYFAPDQTANGVWEDSALLWEQSPLSHANKVTTPTLFLHGNDDRRCPANESLQMYSALLQHGVPARMVLFYGEGHGFSRTGRPQSRIRCLRETAAWLHQHLEDTATGETTYKPEHEEDLFEEPPVFVDYAKQEPVYRYDVAEDITLAAPATSQMPPVQPAQPAVAEPEVPVEDWFTRQAALEAAEQDKAPLHPLAEEATQTADVFAPDMYQAGLQPENETGDWFATHPVPQAPVQTEEAFVESAYETAPQQNANESWFAARTEPLAPAQKGNAYTPPAQPVVQPQPEEPAPAMFTQYAQPETFLQGEETVPAPAQAPPAQVQHRQSLFAEQAPATPQEGTPRFFNSPATLTREETAITPSTAAVESESLPLFPEAEEGYAGGAEQGTSLTELERELFKDD